MFRISLEEEQVSGCLDKTERSLQGWRESAIGGGRLCMVESRIKITGSADVVAEVSRLLEGICFSDSSGKYLAGNRVAVVIDPRLNEDQRTLSVIVSFHLFGHQKVNWSGKVLVLELEGKKTPSRSFAPIDPRGQAFFSAVERSSYRMSLRERSGDALSLGSDQPVIKPE